jgi:hypothetical protein
LEIPKPDLCELGEAVAGYAYGFPKSKSETFFVMQASPHFWSNLSFSVIENGQPQRLNFWKAFTDSGLNLKGSIRAFFDALTILFKPMKVTNWDPKSRRNTLKFLSFRKEGRNQRCFYDYLKKSEISTEQILFIMDLESLDLNSNPKLVDEFQNCFLRSDCVPGAFFDEFVNLKNYL